MENSYDLVVASGALQYAEDWKSTLLMISKKAKPWRFVARVMIFDGEKKLLREDGDITLWGFGRRDFLQAAQSMGLVFLGLIPLSA